ncbi:unnamed protein product, partial [Thlaspi arvense]
SDDDDEDVQEPIRQQHGTIFPNDERLIYQAALQDLNQPKTEKDLPPGVLAVPLMRHQKIALEWMRQKEKSVNNCLGGVLVDDQGLGKTISTIALILLQKLKSQSKPQKPRSGKSGGTLVVCPANKVSLEHKLSVLVYHGSKRTKNPTELAKYDVVVTTYALVTNEVPQTLESIPRRFSGALSKFKWLRVVLDEAQTIKNYKTQVARACASLKAKRRWCLSGTPIQNEIFDLYSYFKFLRYHPYADYESFCLKITEPISKNHLRGYKRLQAILRAILLRRTKGTIFDGQPILSLPPKIVRLTKMDFSPEEWSFYKDLETGSQLEFASRKIKAVMENLESLAKQGSQNSKPIKTIVFSQWTGMLDLIEGNFVEKGINFRRLDGTMSLLTRDIAVKEFNNDPNVQVILMSLKAGNLGLNMVSACHVILLDLWWNPTTEDQAIDRAHRIGQTRTVTVLRLTIQNTVEERILTLQAKKREMVASALGEDPGELSATRLTEEDLHYLFYGGCPNFNTHVTLIIKRGHRLMMDSAIDNDKYSSGSDEEVQDAQKTTINERVIYQAALQDLKQPKTERDYLLGLGKTISTIALILFQKLKSQSKPRKPRSRKSGGTLIVCPASVVKQWEREIDENVSNEHKLYVLVYHGSNRTKDPIELAKHDVVVTTYAIVTNEVPQTPLLDYYYERSKKRDRESTETTYYFGPLSRVRWLRVVLDEAQAIKNHRTQVAKACFSLRAKRRWCLSGTPIQNDVVDLYSYFRFLRYHPYAMYKSFSKSIKVPLSKNSLHGYKKLQAVLRAILLRRTKGTLLDGQPIINLPPKEVNLSKVDFSVDEWSFYRKLEILSQLEFEKYASAGSDKNYARMLVMLLRLRQACNHSGD